MSVSANESFFPETPFQNIALACSGGGFRATSFALGTLSYFHRLPWKSGKLIENIQFMASASGGSITTAMYLQSLYENKSFGEYFTRLLSFLQKTAPSGENGEELLENALKTLSDDKVWGNSFKTRNLINAFATVYNDTLNHLTLGTMAKIAQNHHLKGICFNATEFEKGFSFRFQADATTQNAHTGNRYLYFRGNRKADFLKIGDILASSSCFPAGFEPMVFPNDFAYDKHIPALIQEAVDTRRKRVFGLMDGGITDNEALGSLILADKRRQKQQKERFDLMVVCDVSGRFAESYQPPTEEKATGWKKWSVRRIIRWMYAGKILSWVSVAAIVLSFFFNNLVGSKILLATGSLLLFPSLLGGFIYSNFKKGLQKAKTQLDKSNNISWENVVEPYIDYFSGLRLGTVKNMLLARVSSVVILASDIFLKQIRRNIYAYFYENDKWDNRRLSQFLYELSPFNSTNRRDMLKNRNIPSVLKTILNPSPAMETISEKARTMGTTLWFDKQHVEKKKLRDIVACGQFTLCYNLLQYIYELENNLQIWENIKNQADILILKEILQNDWEAFHKDPYWLFEQFTKETGSFKLVS